MGSASEIVDQFVAAWEAKDIDGIMEHFTEDATYTNIPMGPPNEGKENIRTFIEGFIGTCKSIEFVVHHQVVSDDGRIVMNERTDRLDMPDNMVELPVMGVFELRDGKISAWRDYFDIAGFTS